MPKEIMQKHQKRGHYFTDLRKIETIFQNAKQALEGELQIARSQHPDPMNQDTLLENIDELLRGKIGRSYTEEEMANLSVEFEERYKKDIPPGFKDKDKDKVPQNNNKQPPPQLVDPHNPANKYGDVIIWYQIIEYAKQEKRPVIFVVDDVKEDWWQEIHEKKLGPRIELRQEMQKKAGMGFYMYTTDNFIEKAQGFLQLQIQKETVEEVRENRLEEERAKQGRYYIPSNPGPGLLPGPDLFPGPGLYPSPSGSEILKQINAAKQLMEITNAFGGYDEMKRQLQQHQQIIKQIQPFLPPSGTHREGSENLEDFHTSEDGGQGQEDITDHNSDSHTDE